MAIESNCSLSRRVTAYSGSTSGRVPATGHGCADQGEREQPRMQCGVCLGALVEWWVEATYNFMAGQGRAVQYNTKVLKVVRYKTWRDPPNRALGLTVPYLDSRGVLKRHD